MVQTKKEQKTYTKEQLVKSRKYIAYTDFLSGNLVDNKNYSIEEVDELIKKHYGKGKSEKTC